MAVAVLPVLDRSLRKIALGLTVIVSVGSFIVSDLTAVPSWVTTAALVLLIFVLVLDQSAGRIRARVSGHRRTPRLD